MKTRIITALLLLPLAMALIFMPSLKWFSLILIPVFAVLAWEWSGLLQTKSALIKSAFIILSVSIVGLFYYQLVQLNFFEYPAEYFIKNKSSLIVDAYPFKALLVGLLVWIVAFILIFLYPNGSKLWSKGAALRMLFGWVMLPVAWLAVVLIRSAQYNLDHYYGGWLLLVMFFIIWGADVGAYLAGKNFGKHKLSPKVSPNKTWEGVFGGILAAVILATGLGYYIGLPVQLTYFIPMVLGLVFVSVMGDLFESMLKRQAYVKDSSNILPGHGGLLDRLDSTLSVAPFFVVALLWFNGSL